MNNEIKQELETKDTACCCSRLFTKHNLLKILVCVSVIVLMIFFCHEINRWLIHRDMNKFTSDFSISMGRHGFIDINNDVEPDIERLNKGLCKLIEQQGIVIVKLYNIESKLNSLLVKAPVSVSQTKNTEPVPTVKNSSNKGVASSSSTAQHKNLQPLRKQ